MKAQVLCEHIARISRQTAQRIIYKKATGKVDSNINDVKCAVLQAPTAGAHSWKRTKRETDAPVGPITRTENCYKSGTTIISTPITISGIHSHSRKYKKMECTIILPTSRDIDTRQNINASPIKNPTNNLHLMFRALHQSSSENSAALCHLFGLKAYRHRVSFNLCVQKALNTRLEAIEHKQSAQKPMPLYKRTLYS